MSAITLEHIRKSFGDKEIIKGVDLAIDEGEFVVFVGPSGCGKSTLLRLICGLEDISAGDMYIAEERVNDLPPSERGIGMVFQSYALYPHMTVYKNMAFGLERSKTDKAEVDRRVREAAEILQITHLLDRLPKELSGGQRQRVAIGRAIVRQPKVFLFDEPLSNLDASLRVQTRIEIAKLHKELGSTMIYVTHDQVEAMTLADRIVVLRDGLIEQVGTPMELYHHPANTFVAGFIGSPQMNFIEAEVNNVDASGVTITLPEKDKTITLPFDGATVRLGDIVTLGIRPEHMGAEEGEILSAEVTLVEKLGSESYIYLSLANGSQITSCIAGDEALQAGDTLQIAISPEDCHLFDRDALALPPLRRPSKKAA